MAHDKMLPLLHVSPSSGFCLGGTVNGIAVTFLLDTGAAVSLLRKEVWDRISRQSVELEPWREKRLVGVEGTPLRVEGCVTVTAEMGGEQFDIRLVVVDQLTAEAILGLDFLRKNECIIDTAQGRVNFAAKAVAFPLLPSEETDTRIQVVLQETVHIPARSELDVAGAAKEGRESEAVWLLQPERSQRIPVLVAHAVVTCNSTDSFVPLRLLNPRSEPVTLFKGTKIATLETLAEASIQETAETEVGSVSTVLETLPLVSLRKQNLLEELVEKTGDGLSTTEKEQLQLLLETYADVFAEHGADIGRTGRVQHQIDTGSSPPIRQPLRRMPLAKRDQAQKLLQDMLERDIVEPSNSPWASPIVLVTKRDGTARFCVDFRRLNAITRRDAYPLPRIDDTLDTLAGSRWFSTLDLVSGYWQVEVDPRDRDKTAFCTAEGLYQFKVMPFGLTNAPATFQRLMDAVLAGLQWKICLVYLDDIIIVGRTFEEHLCHLQEVFARLRQARLKLKVTKCSLFQKEVSYLGHIVSDRGIATDPSKTAKVAQWPVPTTVKEVQQFLGLANYYRRFVKDFATIARPLHRLTEHQMKFKWTTECQDAFEDLRRRLISAPVLAYPDFSRGFILDTDASDMGIGAVLSQAGAEGEQVIAYASRVLSKPERRYCVTRRELLSAVTFIQHFRPYLLGRHFILRTDHGSLVWLQNFREPEGQLARWLEKLQEYNFTVTHRKGTKHKNADALSRLPCTQCGRQEFEPEPTPTQSSLEAVCTVAMLEGMTPDELRQAQLQDPVLGPLLQSVESGQKPSQDQAIGVGREHNRLLQQWKQLELSNGLLHRRYENDQGNHMHLQLVVPGALRQKVLQEIHGGLSGGHLGEEKTANRLKERFYWPGHWQDVRSWCRTCTTCATRKMPVPGRRAPLQNIRAGYPLQMIAVDIMGPFPEGDSGNRYILVATDYFTRWVEAYAIPNQEAKTVASKLVGDFFFRFSIPERLHSDQGRQFESDLISHICQLLGIRKTRTTPYHPQSDGLVERLNRTLLHMLATSAKDHPSDWEKFLQPVCLAYNTSLHPTTGYTPFFLMFGRKARLPVDVAYGTSLPTPTSMDKYARDLQQSLREAYQRVRQQMGSQQERQKDFYDQKVHGLPFSKGELVWLYSPAISRGNSRKLYHPWQGPFWIVKQLSEVTYRIQDTRNRRRRRVVHFDRLKPCTTGCDVQLSLSESAREPVEESTTPLCQQPPLGTRLELLDEMENTDYPPSLVPPALHSSPRPVPSIHQNLPCPPQPLPPVPAHPTPGIPTVTRRYPQRDRRPPDRFAPMISH